MKIGMIMLRHPPTQKSPIMPKVVRLLEEWGATVDSIYPEEQLIDLAKVQVEHDLYVLKSRTPLALSFAGVLHMAGAKTINPYPIVAMMRDKIVATRILLQAGVPMPETYLTGHPEQFASLLDDGGLVLKPHRGSQGRGVQMIWDADELNNVPTNHSSIFGQRYYEPQGPDHKIYCIGSQLFGVKRFWPAKTYEEKLGEPFCIAPELRQIAERCGRAFGVELYGVDLIFSGRQPYVVDINCFPGFKGVPEAALRLADYIYAVGQRILNGEQPFPTIEVNIS